LFERKRGIVANRAEAIDHETFSLWMLGLELSLTQPFAKEPLRITSICHTIVKGKMF
jgi:hypothetical protein